MMNSGQVAQMMAQQNQGFASNQAFAQQISASMPGMYQGGIGGQHMGGGGGFSYGGRPLTGWGGYGQQIGDKAMAVGAGVGSAAAGVAGMTLPFMAGMGAYGAARGAQMGMMGAAGVGAAAALPVMAGIGAIKHIGGSMMAGAREQAGVENVLSQFQVGDQSMATGRGFSRQQSMAVGNMMRKMEALPEMMTSMGELTRIMDKMGQMGMMHGTQSVAEFQRKFKDNLKVLKDMSKVIGSTMEEALPMFGEIRRTGFYSTGDILKNAMSRQITGGITGMNQGQVAGLAATGAQTSFAAGGTRRTGARSATRMANQLGAARSMGVLSDEDIMELTGLEGGAGIQQMSTQLTNAAYRMSGSALGTVATLALGEQEEGRYTGRMDEDLVERLRAGEFSRSDLLRMKAEKTASRASKMSFVARRKQMRAEMAGSVGVEGQFQMLQMILGERGFTNPDAARIAGQNFGLGERETNLLTELGQKMPDMRTELEFRSRAQAKSMAQETLMKEQYSWGAIKDKVGRRVSNAVTKPFKDLGVAIRDSINGAVDDFVEDLTGSYTTEVTQGVSKMFRGTLGRVGGSATAGGTNYRSNMAQALTRQGGLMDASAMTGRDFTTGLTRSLANWATGEGTAGDEVANIMSQSAAGSRALTRGFTESRDLDVGDLQKRGYHVLGRKRGAEGGNILSTDNWQSEYTLASQSGIENTRRALQNLAYGGENADVSKLQSYFDKEKLSSDSFRAGVHQELLEDFEVVQLTHDFKGKTGAAYSQEVIKAMRKRGNLRNTVGGASVDIARKYLQGKDKNEVGGAEVLTYLGRKTGLRGGVEAATAEMAKALSFTGGAGDLHKRITEMEAGLAEDVFGGDDERAQQFIAMMKPSMGGPSAAAMQPFLRRHELARGASIRGGGAGAYGGDFSADPLQGATIDMGGGDPRGKELWQQLKGTEGFNYEFTQEGMEQFIQNEAVRLRKREGRRVLEEGPKKELLATMDAAFQDEVMRQDTMSALRKASGEDPGAYNEEEKAILKQMFGVEDVTDISSEDAKEKKKQLDMLKGMDQTQRGKVQKLVQAWEGEGIVKVGQRFAQLGADQLGRAQKAISFLGKTPERRAKHGKTIEVLRQIEERAQRTKEMGTKEGMATALGYEIVDGVVTKPKQKKVNIQEQLAASSAAAAELDDEGMRVAMGVLGEEAMGIVEARRVQNLLYRKKGGKFRRKKGKLMLKEGLSLESLGITEERASVAGLEGEYEELLGRTAGGDKGKIKTLEQAKQVEEYLIGQAGEKLVTAAGVEQQSSHANPAQIATQMQQFSKNVVSLGEIIEAIAKAKE